ncbi:hypothetical protein [Streptomyces demainii]|uniref:Uncharacterized protein n=1 Tax=Streptomyces demainii TaxID=588122 RepID=A0ABT9KSV7_9ACTN|nr:hypothetical protein [Streptomyces demainii]MDP9611519.1 hypothetical protein [Streptomyces demainii]
MKKTKLIVGRLRGGLSALWGRIADALESPEWWWEVGTTVVMSAIGCFLGLAIAYALYR